MHAIQKLIMSDMNISKLGSSHSFEHQLLSRHLNLFLF